VRVAVVGCGYVGLVTGVGLASVGHDVVGIETDEAAAAAIADGTPRFHEPGLAELLRAQLDAGRFEIVGDVGGTAEADVVFLAVQTPPGESGAIDLGYLARAASAVAAAFAGTPARRRVVAVRSTVVPGTADEVVAPLFDAATAVASNPEFLREGSALDDFLHPDRVVVGCSDEEGRRLLGDLYGPLDAPIVFTTPVTAELAKYVSNAFLATLISFSNEIGRICETLPGVDVEDVLGILHQDRRLSPLVEGRRVRPGILSYLKAGCGYGGSCLPKDLSALLAARRELGHEHPLLEAVRAVNETQPARVVDLAEDVLGPLDGQRVGVLGLAFKGGTDDLRSSPGLRIVDELLARNAEVVVFDPMVRAEALPDLAGRVRFATTLDEALALAEACVVTTDAPEFAALGERLEAPQNGLPTIVDGRRVVSVPADEDARYVAVGRGRTATPPGSRASRA
jgi:UDPglucose 6-dehydrogenase